MRSGLIKFLPLLIAVILLYACNNHRNKSVPAVTYRGLYSFGPEVKSFKDCDNSHEYWVIDSSARLELQYSQMNFEKPYEPVYVEIQGKKIKSGADGIGSEYDSTLIVKKVLKITKEIPQDMCN